MKTGLVLEGGGVRGIYTAGVLDVFMEHGITFDGDIVGADFCYRQLPDELDIYDHEQFYKNTSDFYVTCSNVETGKPEYIQIKDMKTQIDALRASASLPYFSRVVEINDKKYLCKRVYP